MCYKSRIILGLAAVICLIIGMPLSSHAYVGKLQVPPEGKTQRLILNDGTTLFGRITAVNDTNVTFQTNAGVINTATVQIEKIEEILPSSIRDGKYWFPNPARSRLFFGPTARSLKANQGYIYDVWIFFPGVAYGVTDNFMISGGTSIIPSSDLHLYYFTPKVSFKVSEKMDAAISLNIFQLWGAGVGIGLGNLTYGTDDYSITGGLGVAINDEMDVYEHPVGTLGGEIRIARRISLVGESWFFPEEVEQGMFGIAGVRFFGESMAVDLGFTRFTDEEDDFDENGNMVTKSKKQLVPIVSFNWNFML
ncbi:MAG TPA: hypothetical protein DEO84_05620 [candidate division Zixibacteria bacterium]|jgi:hypothetical protein|nr:hypothetical protein [candidate division Zixibacteria bacterium]HBZ00785.1 hypothetical protein [candidate division Zixibacteria bacterium]